MIDVSRSVVIDITLANFGVQHVSFEPCIFFSFCHKVAYISVFVTGLLSVNILTYTKTNAMILAYKIVLNITGRAKIDHNRNKPRVSRGRLWIIGASNSNLLLALKCLYTGCCKL